MKISRGIYKNIEVSIPQSAKPVKSIVLNSLFSSIFERIPNSSCLDLFCGSGILGLTSLSLKAKFCQFVDIDNQATELVKLAIHNIKAQDFTSVTRSSAIAFIENTNDKFDIIFLDPPYNLPVTHVFKTINTMANENCLLVYLSDSEKEIPEIDGFTFIKEKSFGKTKILYFEFRNDSLK